jgi:O-antigen ligase
MGIFSFIAAMMFISAVLMLRKSERTISLTVTVGLLCLAAAGVLWIGIDVIIARYGELMTANALSETDRRIVLRDTLRLTRAFPWGVGIGRYGDVFREFQTYHPELFYDHAHNDYLETAAEWGMAPALGFWVCVLSVFTKLVQRLVVTTSCEEQGVLLACVAAIFAILIHSLGDFNLQIPSNAILFFSFVGVGLGILYPVRPTSPPTGVRRTDVLEYAEREKRESKLGLRLVRRIREAS